MRALLLMVLLAGCSTMQRVDEGTFTINDTLVVTADGRWNRVEPQREGAELWTADGMTLDVLAFYVGVAEGETLGAAPGAGAPRWRASMSPHDIVELYEALVTLEGSTFTLHRLAPASFAGAQGFVFEHTTVTRDGPALGGLAYAAVVGGRLYLMSYTAPKSHFYEKHLGQVRAIAASAQIKGAARNAAKFKSRESAASASP